MWKFLKDTSGNMAVAMAGIITMLIIGVGAGVDMVSVTSEKAKYQSIADAAVLAAARSGETTEAELKIIAQQMVDSHWGTPSPTVAIKLSKDNRIQVHLSGQKQAFIMGLFGKPQNDIKVIAEAPLAVSEPLEVALVLDTTGSMSGAKLTSMKAAANKLVKILDDFDNDAIRVAVVPFQDYVNVGLSRRNETWLDVPGDSSTTGAEVCYMTKDVTGSSNCRTVPQMCTNDGVSYDCSYTTCDYTYGPEYEHCYTPTTTSTWNGCVGSRTTPWNERAHKGTSKIPGLLNEWCGEEILALTDNMSLVISKIDSLTANNNTYIPAGLIWGWRALHPQAPLTEASSKKKNEKTSAIVLMSDGANTLSQNGQYHNGTDVADANKVTANLCNNISSDGVQIYTIAYQFDDPTTLKMLQKCASKKSMFFKATDTASLNKAFEDIGASLLKLRLTH